MLSLITTTKQFSIVKAASTTAPTKIDSLENSLRHMQYKIDSLSKIVHDTEVGHTFFSDVISTNLYMFATIIGLAALLGWGWLEVRLGMQRRIIWNKLKEASKTAEEKFTALQKQIHETIYNVNRAMFGVSKSHERQATTFTWAIGTILSLIDVTTSTKDTLITDWLEISETQLDKVKEDEKKALKDDYKDFLSDIEKIKSHDTITDVQIAKIDNIVEKYMAKAFGDPEQQA